MNGHSNYLAGILAVVKMYSPEANAENMTGKAASSSVTIWYLPNWPTSSTRMLSRSTGLCEPLAPFSSLAILPSLVASSADSRVSGGS